MSDLKEKWDKIYATAGNDPASPCVVLERYSFLLPASGAALDVACGRGGNALYLARNGLAATAVDISDKACHALNNSARAQGLSVTAVAAPIENWLELPENNGFNVIVVSRFLDRSLFPTLLKRVRNGGLIYYQTFVKDKTDTAIGPGNPDYLLDQNELLLAFQSLAIRAFYDPGSTGNTGEGLRNESYIVAQKVVNK